MGTAASLVLGFLLSTAYGSGFHVIMGGPARRILLYVLAAWIGFAIGHFVGDLLNVTVFQLGALHLLMASLGAWIALLSSWWLLAHETS